MGEVASETRIHVFKIRKIDINVGSEGLESGDIVVAVAVVNDGGEESSLVKGVEQRRDRGGIVGWRDETEDILTDLEHLSNAINDLVKGVIEDETGVNLSA